MTTPRRSTFLDALAVALAASGATGMSIRLTVRDALPLASNVFYAMPPPLIAALILGAGLVWLGNRRPRVALSCFVISALTAGLWVRGAYHRDACRPDEGSVQVLLWNTARGFGGWEAVARRVASFDADIIGLVEAGGSGADRREFWGRHFPGYDLHLAGGGLVILTRGRIAERHTLRVAETSSCAEAWIEIDGQRVRVLLVDAVVRPFDRRGDVLDRVFDLARSSPETPTVVMGDFNTPLDSVWFESARRDFVHVFEQAGNGLLTTWPVPLPVLAIDHVWVSRPARVVCAHIGWTWASDHRPVSARLSLRRGGPT